MTDSCIVCECEPIGLRDYYLNQHTTEIVCRWCVEDLHKVKEILEKK